MLKTTGVHDARCYITLRAKGKLENKPSYFSVGGFEIPVDIGAGKKYDFQFDWVQSSGNATLNADGIYELDFGLKELDFEFINDSFDCEKDLDLLTIFRSIETVGLNEIHYCWDKVLEDGKIETDPEHFFDVVSFEIEVLSIKDSELVSETFRAPIELIDAYNKKIDKQWV